ncbi:MAG: respiratory nitrate reductase subunit gamma [Negativicutes bacterium]|nr:respiratory nitrate reductase subunit gamma [Negativicutes bacterium]
MISWLISGPFMYLAVLVFLAATVKKVLAIARMPRHLRWDLYPIAHEGPAGSIFQKVEFWKSPRPFSIVHELTEMAQEILLLKKTFLYNRRIWLFSFPMHVGFYLIIAWLGLIVAGSLTELATGIIISGASTIFWAQIVNAVTLAVGIPGLVAGLYGTLGLLWIRYTDEDLKDYTSPVTFLNLYLLIALFAVGLAAWFAADPSFAVVRGYVASLVTFRPVAVGHPLMLLEIVLFGAFLMYLPFSRMLHFAAKYFFYHNIMWDDELVTPGSGLEKSISSCLGYQVEWGASHIKAHGSWLEQATTNPTRPMQEVKPADEAKSQS